MSRCLDKGLKSYKRETLKIAKQLNYDIFVIEKIDCATSIPEIERIMVDARRDASSRENNNRSNEGQLLKKKRS